MSNQEPPNRWADRRIQAYPPPKYHNLTTAYAKANDMKESAAVSHIIKEFFDKMPAQERERIIQVSKNSY